MKKKTLAIVMRSSIQIHNLLEVTKERLENMATRYKLQEKPKVHLETITKTLWPSNRAMKRCAAQFTAFYLELDEAFDYVGIPTANDGKGVKIENRFKYQKPMHIGHGAESKLPVVFQLCQYKSKLQKIISLAAIFEKMELASSSANSKHFLLHINVNNGIVKLAFKMFNLKHNTKISTKVTASYKEFTSDSLRKYVFAGKFRTFTGLQYSSRIAIMLDCALLDVQQILMLLYWEQTKP